MTICYVLYVKIMKIYIVIIRPKTAISEYFGVCAVQWDFKHWFNQPLTPKLCICVCEWVWGAGQETRKKQSNQSETDQWRCRQIRAAERNKLHLL